MNLRFLKDWLFSKDEKKSTPEKADAKRNPKENVKDVIDALKMFEKVDGMPEEIIVIEKKYQKLIEETFKDIESQFKKSKQERKELTLNDYIEEKWEKIREICRAEEAGLSQSDPKYPQLKMFYSRLDRVLGIVASDSEYRPPTPKS